MTTRAAIVFALFALPAQAEAVIAWGGTSARIDAADGPQIATITCTNRLTSGHDSMTQGVVSLGGFDVHIRVIHQPGDTPDRFIVTPPDGYIAIPPQIDVPEGASAKILIFAISGALS
jgi:hypothetical protein